MTRLHKKLDVLQLLISLNAIIAAWGIPLPLTSNSNTYAYVNALMRLAKSAEMRNYMNVSVDPCENFYNFACGNWAKVNPANSWDQITTGLFENLNKALDRKVRTLLNSNAASQTRSVTDEKVVSFYKSCMGIKNIYNVYRTQLLLIIADLGEMPILMPDDAKWQEDKFDWVETLAKILNKYNKNIIFGLEILPDYANNTQNCVYIGYSSLPLNYRTMYLDNTTAIYRMNYKAKIVEDLKRFLGVEHNRAHKAAAEMLDFEINLAKGMFEETVDLDIDEMSIATTVEEMQQRYAPVIDIEKFVSIALGRKVNGKVYEFAEDYNQNLVAVVQRTPKRVIANYIFYMLLEEFFLKVAKTEEKQHTICIEKVKNYFSKNIDNMIYRQYTTNATENDVQIIWKAIKFTFKKLLNSNKLNWIQQSTRKTALEKLEAMKLEISSYVNTNFEGEFAELTVGMNYVDNIKNIMMFNSKQNKEKLDKPAEEFEFAEILSYTPANIILENTIKIPVSLLQPFYLWASIYPNALKFGTLGALIGHELVHGFDDNGRKFDKFGNMNDWWDMESTLKFDERTACFKNQYSQYSYGSGHLSKNMVQSENIADNGGIRIAYAAYMKWYEKAVNGNTDLEFEVMPKMNYTSKQLFFISYAQVWCSDVNKNIIDLQTSIDQHVPSIYRVIGPLSNMEEFSREFNCAANTPMNPRKKCRIY